MKLRTAPGIKKNLGFHFVHPEGMGDEVARKADEKEQK